LVSLPKRGEKKRNRKTPKNQGETAPEKGAETLPRVWGEGEDLIEEKRKKVHDVS